MITQATPGSERRAVPRPPRVFVVVAAAGLVLALAAFPVAFSVDRYSVYFENNLHKGNLKGRC